MANPIRVLIAEDHALVRAGIHSLLNRLPGIEVVAEANDGRKALKLYRVHKTDVVLMDIAMPGLNGLDATSRLAREEPPARVIILSMHATRDYVVEALRAGAQGYVLKNALVEELETAIRSVTRGEKYVTPAVSEQVVSAVLEHGGKSGHEGLTPRQREVVQLIAEGQSTRAIAEALHLSVKTVETHRAQLMERLGIRDVAGLTRYAIRTGLVAPDA